MTSDIDVDGKTYDSEIGF